MALKRWRWIWGPALAALVLAALALPPTVLTERGLLSVFGLGFSYWEYRPGTAFRASVRSATQVQERRLREALLADSVLAAARGPRALRSDDGSVTVVYETPLTVDSARVWLRAASAELALYPRMGSGGLPIVVALFSNPARSRSRAADSRYLWFPTLELLSAAPTRGACVVTLHLLSRRMASLGRLVAHDASGHPLGRFLDLCALYGRFGLPGPRVARWVGRGPNAYWLQRDPLALRMQETRRALKREEILRSLDASGSWAGFYFWREVACLRGAAPMCAHAAGLEPVPERRFYGSYYFTGGQLLAHLLTQGTPAQFAAFWRSPLEPKEALATAYGEPADRLAMSAFSRWYRVSSPGGPRAGGRVVLAGFAWAGLALALAVVAGRRRTTGI